MTMLQLFLRIFLAFSNFLEMHDLMANHRIGLLTMKVIDYEVKRSEHRENERLERESFFDQEIANTKRSDKLTPVSKNNTS